MTTRRQEDGQEIAEGVMSLFDKRSSLEGGLEALKKRPTKGDRKVYDVVLSRCDDSGVTSREIASATGLSFPTITRALVKGIKNGFIRKEIGIDGVPVYHGTKASCEFGLELGKIASDTLAAIRDEERTFRLPRKLGVATEPLCKRLEKLEKMDLAETRTRLTDVGEELIERRGQSLDGLGDVGLEATKASKAEAALLSLLKSSCAITQKEMQDRSGVSAATVSRFVKKALRLGLIKETSLQTGIGRIGGQNVYSLTGNVVDGSCLVGAIGIETLRSIDPENGTDIRDLEKDLGLHRATLTRRLQALEELGYAKTTAYITDDGKGLLRNEGLGDIADRVSIGMVLIGAVGIWLGFKKLRSL